MRGKLRELERTPLDIVVFAVSAEKASTDLSLLMGETEDWFEVRPFATEDTINADLLRRLSSADAVIIYSDEPENDLEGLVSTALLVSSATFRWKMFLVGDSASLVEKAILSVLRVNQRHLITIEQKMKLIEVMATELVNIIPDTALYSACANKVLREAVLLNFPEISARLLLKSLLAPAIFGPLGVKTAYDEFAELVKLFAEFYPQTRLTDERLAAVVLTLVTFLIERPLGFTSRLVLPVFVYAVLKLLRKANRTAFS